MKKFDFDELFIFDIANNHQGDLAHGLNIIRKVGEVAQAEGVRAALKFQFRQLDSFVHPAYRESADNKHIPRFMSTRLEKEDYIRMADAVRDAGMITMSTPFDEESVDVIIEQNIQVIKIASCSATDTPLLEKVAQANKPVVASTAGLRISEIDRLVSLFDSHDLDFAIMHCVALYPTPEENLNLNQISFLRARYPHVPIGFSTHEDPDFELAVQLAFAKGSRLFERHVGLETEAYKLNAYSSNPEQLTRWIRCYKQSRAVCGAEHRAPAPPDETASLNTLKRGVYLRADVKKGDVIERDDVFFAMPKQENQLSSGSWYEGIVANRDYEKDDPLDQSLANLRQSKEQMISDIMLQVRGMLNEARISTGPNSSVEISHHYGMDRFREFGAVIVDCVNREYCKKLLVMLPRQKHPYHYHKRKEETFQLLYGDLEIEANGSARQMEAGETFLVSPGTWHKFHSLGGAIVEEISTTHFKNDSIYEDEMINQLSLSERKTKVSHL